MLNPSESDTAHPNEVSVIKSVDFRWILAVQGLLAVFTSEEKASEYGAKTNVGRIVIDTGSWNEIVDAYGNMFKQCIVDYAGVSGHYEVFLLKRDI